VGRCAYVVCSYVKPGALNTVDRHPEHGAQFFYFVPPQRDNSNDDNNTVHRRATNRAINRSEKNERTKTNNYRGRARRLAFSVREEGRGGKELTDTNMCNTTASCVWLVSRIAACVHDGDYAERTVDATVCQRAKTLRKSTSANRTRPDDD